jgi:hypothetical protein
LILWRAHWREEEIPEDNNKENGHLQAQQLQLEGLEHQEISMITCLSETNSSLKLQPEISLTSEISVKSPCLWASFHP